MNSRKTSIRLAYSLSRNDSTTYNYAFAFLPDGLDVFRPILHDPRCFTSYTNDDQPA